MQPVPGQIEVKTVALLADRQAAQLGLAFEQNPGLAQVKGRRDPGETSAKNDYLARFLGHG
jgi:hypothetical protein